MSVRLSPVTLSGKKAWFGLSTPLPFRSKQWDWRNFDYNPSSCVAQVGPRTHPPTPLRALRKPVVTYSCSSWKHLCCLLGQHLPGNQVAVRVNNGILVTFKMELGGFWSCCPQLMGLLKAFLWASFWLPSQHAAGSAAGAPVQAACRDLKPPVLFHSALTATNQDNYLASLLVFNLFLRPGTVIYFAYCWI